MNVLGIDTSCDDTAVAVVADGRVIRSSVIMSQTRLHAEHGGVVPEVASRRHLEDMRPAVTRALEEAGLGLNDLDMVAATVGPGLAGSLMVGYNLGRALALGRCLSFVPVNHMEGHIYSAWLDPSRLPGSAPLPEEPRFPLLVLIVSGGHTELVLMTDHGAFRRLGATRDDAAGEAFDKVGRLLGLPYPGGPSVQRAAADLPAGQKPIALPRAWLRGGYDFSFSGLKTAVLHLVQEREGQASPPAPLPTTGEGSRNPSLSTVGEGGRRPSPSAVGDGSEGDPARIVEQKDGPRGLAAQGRLSPGWVSAVAAGFQDSVADVLATKTATAAREFGVRDVVLCGGVAANEAVRERLRAALPAEAVLHVPPPALCTDNGAMIAAAGYYRRDTAVAPVASIDVQPGLTLPL